MEAVAGTGATDRLDVATVRKDFPIYQAHEGRPFVFLDSASSSQRPRAVLDAMDDLYETTYANVHRGVYAISEETTARFERARTTLALSLIHISEPTRPY